MYFVASALSLVLAAPASAGDKPARTFEHEGITYTYTSTKTADATVLEGRAHPLGGNFRLTVREGKVTGRAGATRVAFRVKDAALKD